MGKKSLRTLCLLLAVMMWGIWTVKAVPYHEQVIFAYVSGADLEQRKGWAMRDIREMQDGTAGVSGEKAYVAVRAGGSPRWHWERFMGIDMRDNFVNEQDLMLLNGFVDGHGRGTEMPNNMGSGQNLQQFLTGTVHAGQTESLILWGHGGGPLVGYIKDPVYDDRLSLKELTAALQAKVSQEGRKFKVLVMFSCLGGTLELAHAVAPYAEYLVAGQGVMYVSGLDYNKAIAQLIQKPDLPAETAAMAFLDAYFEECASYGRVDEVTCSVIDLSKIPTLVEEMNRLADAMNDAILSGEIRALATARAATLTFGDYPERGLLSDLMDIGDFVQKLTDADLYTAEASWVHDALSLAVPHHLSGDDHPGASGLSVYFPFRDKENAWVRSLQYGEMDFAQTYQDFVGGWAELISQAASLPAPTAALSAPALASVTGTDGMFPFLHATQTATAGRLTADVAARVIHMERFVGARMQGVLVPLWTGPVPGNEQGGFLPEPDWQQGVRLAGVPLGVVFAGQTGTVERYRSSALLNGEEVLLNLRRTGGQVSLQGLSFLSAEDPFDFGRDSITPAQGDVLQPLYRVWHQGKLQTFKGPEIRLAQATPVFSWGNIPNAISGYRVMDTQGTLHEWTNDGGSWYSTMRVPTLPSSWAVPEIVTAISKELVPEPLLGAYKEKITRREFAGIAVKLYEGLSGNFAPLPTDNPFLDTADPYVRKAHALGIVAGTGAGLFSPERLLTREQLALMFVNVLKAISPDISTHALMPDFSDAGQVSSWARDEVAFISAHGILQGTGNRLNPRGDATREQAMLLAVRLHAWFPTYRPLPLPGPTPGPASEEAATIMGLTRASTGHIDLINYGSVSLDVSGWYITMNATESTFHLPSGTHLPAGETLRIATGPQAAEATQEVLFWTLEALLATGDGTGRIYRADGVKVGDIRPRIVLEAK